MGDSEKQLQQVTADKLGDGKRSVFMKSFEEENKLFFLIIRTPILPHNQDSVYVSQAQHKVK